ncbi:MAG TPA: divalent metal cation transporter, partial [Candidatus Sulfotelmatobacter sp.]|nr:divalent metal cation transporter [Candidatus Sulfotelmatobacter sp.]
LYTVLVGAGAALILLPRFPLLKMPVLSQVLNGVLLPFVLIFMLLLVNKRYLMGSYVNSKFFNWVAWTTAAVMIALSMLLIFQ